MQREHRVAIIGVGAIAGIHAECIVKDIANAELVAGSCRSEEKGRKFADKWGCTWCADYERMLDEVKPDVATICLPSGAHLEAALACARRGIHVLCEKPLEITTERADRMIAAAREAGITLGGIFPQRFNPTVATVRRAAAEGRFGRIAAASACVPWWRHDEYYAPGRWQGTAALDGGGALMNQSIHTVDALLWIVQASMPAQEPGANPVAEVSAYTGKCAHPEDLIEVEDTAVAVLKFSNGCLGTILGATSMFPGSHRRLMIGGRDGTAEIVESRLALWSFRQEKPEDETLRKRFGEQGAAQGASDPMSLDRSPHTANIREFLAALDERRRPAIDGVEARKAVAVIEAVYLAVREGRPVRVG